MLRKIVLIGAEGFSYAGEQHRVTSYPWSKLGKITNLSDYDEVVVNLASLPTATGVDWRAFDAMFTLRTLAEVLNPDGRIIVLGDPRFEIPSPERSGRPSQQTSRTVLDWTRLGLQWDDREGDTIEPAFANDGDEQAYGRYLSHLTKWHFALRDFNPDIESLADAYGFDVDRMRRQGVRLGLERRSYARNRYEDVIAGEVRVVVYEDTGYVTRANEPHYRTVHSMGPLVFLPSVNLPDAEALRVLLEDACGVSLAVDEPSWVQSLAVPGQADLEAAIRQIQTEIDEATTRLEARWGEWDAIRKSLQLLYGQHKQLEEAVRQALRELGAEVEEPEESNKEDAWGHVQLGDEVFEFVLEVKSTEKETFDEFGLRQLGEWVLRGIQLRDTKYKGIFVGNASAKLPPEERGMPFGNNFAKQAAMQEVVALRSEDLYVALMNRRRGTFDAPRFWRSLSLTCGVFTYNAVEA